MEAEAAFRRLLQLHPAAFQGLMFLAINSMAQGDLAQAVVSAEQSHRMSPRHSHPAAILAALMVRTGNQGRAEELLAGLGPPMTYGVPTAMTFFYSMTGDLNSAAEWAEKAVEQRDPRIALGMLSPMMAEFRSTPGGRAIMRLMKLPD